jgi:hypothetical protein
MLKKMVPFDLVGACVSCGTTVAELSEETGIPERELLLFSIGRLALSPRDWFAIMESMSESSERLPSPLRASRSCWAS